MINLLLRTWSQTIQAFLPVIVALVWLRRQDDEAGAGAVRRGLIGGVLLTPLVGLWFQHVARQSQLEASLAWTAAGIALTALLASARTFAGVSTPRRISSIARTALVLAAIVLIVRQTMEVAVVAWVAVFELRSSEAILATLGGLGLGLGVVVTYVVAGRAAPPAVVAAAIRAFGVLYLAQATLYAVHESAESGWLPFSSAVHAATEPYGPDGIYGPLGSGRVAIVPLLVGIALNGRERTSKSAAPQPRRLALATLAIVLLSAAFAAFRHHQVSDEGSGFSIPANSSGGATAVAAPGSILFRGTGLGQGYGLLASAAPGGAPGIAALACERIAYGGGRGLCLQAKRALFTTYRAVLFDSTLTASRTMPLDGSPSRARVSADGRVGAITVFDTGIHSYSATTFSTITLLIDMTTGERLGNLEDFSTWRDGVRIKAADFNFWGVTFARDPTTFYATLRTAGLTYLVRGDLALRKLTVLRENVECPSLSPDNRRIAFKKRVGPASAPWRLYVLDVDSLTEHEISTEHRSVDDQIEWLDDRQVLYGVPRPSPSAVSDVWVTPVDGSAEPRVFLPEAESPVVVR